MTDQPPPPDPDVWTDDQLDRVARFTNQLCVECGQPPHRHTAPALQPVPITDQEEA
jgi:hypothetical protein